jgi:hypothetical protein
MMITIMPWSLRKPVLLTLLITVTPTSFAADLFRWVDKKGNVHYTDRVPPEYVQNGYRVINQQGLTITTISAKKDEPDQKVSAEARAQLERDRRLLTIYSNADEINTTRDRKLAEIKNGISMRQDTLTLLERQFREQTREAGDYEKQNEAVPATLIANINTTKKKISAYEDAIKQQQQLLLDTHKQYGEELERYKKISQAVEQSSPSD